MWISRPNFLLPSVTGPLLSADKRHISDMPERATQLGASEYRSEIIRILQWAQFEVPLSQETLIDDVFWIEARHTTHLPEPAPMTTRYRYDNSRG
jgi:hypothetical protein